ncbi:MAG: citrulline utilization hydrolase CtlX [Sphingobacterium sp.]
MQSTHTVLMVRPAAFRRNEETAVNNFFQGEPAKTDRLPELALAEFDQYAETLTRAGVRVIVLQDPGELDTPDSIFPNNVVSFHGDRAIIYPMFAENRRHERQLNYLGQLDRQGIRFEKVQDYTAFEEQKKFLESTGSLVLDREAKLAYCAISDRSHEEVLHIFCKDQGYQPVVFHAYQFIDSAYQAVYHTNVMLSVGSHFALICLESIRSTDERLLVEAKLRATGKDIIAISEDQMWHFAGNVLEAKNFEGEPLICMSTQAFEALEDEQVERLNRYGKIVHSQLYSIERYGGGGARCMMAEIF